MPAHPAGMSDEALIAAIRRCTLCPDLPLGPRPLLQWRSDAPILIAGQAPGRKTHEQGRPFCDVSGDRLRDWLGVDRPTFYDPARFAIVPMAFCYPGSGPSGDLPPPPRCALQWRSALLERMPRLELTILLGRHAVAWHLPGRRQPMAELAAEWRYMLPSTIVLPHPSPRNRHWFSRHAWFENELLPALRCRIQQVLAAPLGR